MHPSDSGAANAGSWHPAFRPDDNQEFGSSNSEPISEAAYSVPSGQPDPDASFDSLLNLPSERFSNSTEPLAEPTNGDATLQERLPLIDSESKADNVSNERRDSLTLAENQTWSASGNENEAFFDRPALIVEDTATASSLDLDHKVTSAVFESANPSSDHASASLRQATESASVQDSAPQDKTGAATEKALDGKANQPADVSALWDAVLDDDDFLAEDSDGFLPDSSAESSPDSPSSFLGSLNDGSTFQEPDEVLSRYDSQSSVGERALGQNDLGRQSNGQHTSNPYAPHQPSSSDLVQLSSTTYGNIALSRSNLAPTSSGQDSFQRQLQRPPLPSKAESFADQSKDGYKSPYDLPMDLSKPRKRVQQQQLPSAPAVPAPPPRSSSMVLDPQSASDVGPLQSSFAPSTATFEGQGLPPSSHQSAAPSSGNRSVSNEQPDFPKTKVSSPSFFEELPFTARPRPQTAQGRYTPAQTGVLPPYMPPASPAAHQLPPSMHMPPPPVPTKKSSADAYAQYQLQRPERLDPYASVPLQPSAATAVPNTRYSPAPPTSHTAPLPSRYSPAPPSSQIAPPPSAPSRYSPAPPPPSNVMSTQNRYASQTQSSPQISPQTAAPQTRYPSQPVPPASNLLPFQPRTSSPLAYHGKQPDLRVEGSYERRDRTPTSPPSRIPPPQHVPPQVESPPLLADAAQGHSIAPPRRSQTQSPGKHGPVSSLITTSDDLMQRPASVHGPSSPNMSANPYQSFPPARPSVRQRGLSQHLNFIPPTDGLQDDDLQRWRGSPIFRFGLGGSILSSFPKHIPRYAAGSAMPMIKPIAGEIQVRNAKEMLTISEHVAKFPGPLRSKSKKKEVLAWLSEQIVVLENTSPSAFSQQGQPSDAIKKHEERVLLWKLIRVIVEHDGTVDGNAEVQRAVNLILSPDSASRPDHPLPSNVMGSDVAGIYKPQGTTSNTVTVDPGAVESVRRSLLRGEREKAVWTAVDNRLWAHAMLLSSTLDKSIWKQVAHEFVRQEIKRVGINTESLAALYEIFAGNLEESVDELVPPSARAGHQMVNTVIGGAGPTKSALEGLDRWRETLGLVLNNRSPDDHKALAALGGLLGSYGRIEASHICHLFAFSPTMPSIFGGIDDPQASIVLLGADHRSQPDEFFLDEDAVLLTEVYEFASSVLAAGSKSALMPHLQAYKLQRVKSLAEAGFKPEAQAYCDAMGASLRSTTKLSLYYHPQFLAELDDLTQRLSQAPSGTSSWISKPTMGKVSDSMWNKFTTFVAGDESEAASNGSGKDAGHEFGPFAKVSGTPTMSRSGSISDLYGSYASAPQAMPNSMAGAKYAPNGQYSARSSSELTGGRPSLDSQRSPSYLPSGSIQRSPYDPNASHNQQSYMSTPIPAQSSSSYTPLSGAPQLQPYLATPPQTSFMPMAQPDDQTSPNQRRQPESYASTSPAMQPDAYVSSPPLPVIASDLRPEERNAPPFGGYIPLEPEPQGSSSPNPYSYAPPLQSYGSSEPPSAEYVPYQADPTSDPEPEPHQPKKQSFMDDDGDFPPSNYAAQQNLSPNLSDDIATISARKKANDAATEAAFLAAAEADAARDKASNSQTQQTLKAKSSWFSLFSRKDPNNSLDPNSNSSGSNKPSGGGPGEQKVIRAKLGEESSFYYDKELKKWVNKKDPTGAQQQGAKATPPPPKGPVGRVVSESLGAGVGGDGPPTGPSRSGFTAPPPSLSSSRPASSNGVPSRAGTPGEVSGSGALGPGTIMSSSSPPVDHGMSISTTGVTGGSAAPPPPINRPPTTTALSTVSDIDDLLGGPPTAAGRKPGGTLKTKRGRGRYVDIMAK